MEGGVREDCQGMFESRPPTSEGAGCAQGRLSNRALSSFRAAVDMGKSGRRRNPWNRRAPVTGSSVASKRSHLFTI